jgi:hypothetical protein
LPESVHRDCGERPHGGTGEGALDAISTAVRHRARRLGGIGSVLKRRSAESGREDEIRESTGENCSMRMDGGWSFRDGVSNWIRLSPVNDCGE